MHSIDQPAVRRTLSFQNGKIDMKPQLHLPRPIPRRYSVAMAALFAGLMTLSAPVANAGGLVGGIHSLFGHHYAGTYYRAWDYIRVPRRNAAPAFASPHLLPTVTKTAPYQRYSSGGSAVYTSSITKKHGTKKHGTKKHGHGARAMKHAVHEKPVRQSSKYRHRSGGKYVRLVGVNRKTYSCVGHEGQPESYNCVEVSSRYIPRQSPWTPVGRPGHGH